MSCEHCVQGNALPGEPKGNLVGNAYYATQGSSKTAIVLMTDIFGVFLVNPKIIADRLSESTGFDVWVPDLFAGSPPVQVDELEPLFSRKPGQTTSVGTKLKLFWLILTHAFAMYRCRSSVIDERATKFTENLKREKNYEKMGSVGFCLGGGICIRLASQSLFDSTVIAHPATPTVDQLKAIKIPSAWVCAEDDMAFSAALRNEAEAIFAARKDTPQFVDYEFKDYKGTVHGFAARPAREIPESVEGYEKAMEQTVSWFKKTLAP